MNKNRMQTSNRNKYSENKVENYKNYDINWENVMENRSRYKGLKEAIYNERESG